MGGTSQGSLQVLGATVILVRPAAVQAQADEVVGGVAHPDERAGATVFQQ